MTVREQRAMAEERSWALLRSIVPEDEWKPDTTFIRFTSQHGNTYVIEFESTSENIYRENDNVCICGGPYVWADFTAPCGPDSWILDSEKYAVALASVVAEGERYAPHLPEADVFLGQYLALKYDEDKFMATACY